MNGQWTGRYSGTNAGLLVVDLDDLGTHYEGLACAYDDNPTLPGIFASITTTDKQPTFDGRVPLRPIDPRTGEPTEWNDVAGLYPQGVITPDWADVHLDFSGGTLTINWETNIDTSGTAKIKQTEANALTEYQPLSHVTNWKEFKAHVGMLGHRRYIFRGQSRTLRLRTAFHRTGRANLIRFLENDVRTLHRHLSSRTTHVFNLALPDENGAFLNLVQHHGYPTPLLDWTFSPFVAAFFAYHRLKNSEARTGTAGNVRVFIFDQESWRKQFNQLTRLTWRKPNFSIMEFIAIDNERLIPQQSISSVTNIDDIESYIRSTETDGRKFLEIIDLPISERPIVMKELSVMGITAGSLFPGFDGACEELRERFFDL
jgi:FRG domain